MTKFQRIIAAGEFKAKCLELMDHVQRTNSQIVITKRGKPIAKLSSMAAEEREFFGCMKGSAKVVGDIISPVGTDWESNA